MAFFSEGSFGERAMHFFLRFMMLYDEEMAKEGESFLVMRIT
jgi:hypothetical protein